MDQAFWLVVYGVMVIVSGAHGVCGQWQPAIWMLFLLTVIQNIVRQYGLVGSG